METVLCREAAPAISWDMRASLGAFLLQSLSLRPRVGFLDLSCAGPGFELDAPFGPFQLCASALCYFCSSWCPGNAGVRRSSGPFQRAWQWMKRYFCISCCHWKLQADFLMGRAASVHPVTPPVCICACDHATSPPRANTGPGQAPAVHPHGLGMDGSPPRWALRKEGGLWPCSGGCVISHFPFEAGDDACRTEEPSEAQSLQCS